MKQPIVRFAKDEVGDWVAYPACGHGQHVRHRPPWIERPWVTTSKGRRRFIGRLLDCKLCDK